MKIKKLLSLSVLALLLVLTSCTGGGNETPSGKKELRLIKNADIMSLDSALATDEMSFEVLGSINEGLYYIDGDGLEQPAMVESDTVSADGLVFTFKLKDAKWSNGDPVTAHDFVFAWRKLVDPKTASEYSFIADTAGLKNAAKISAGELPTTDLGVKALDDKTLEVTLERQVPFFKKVIAFGSFLPQNEKFVTEKGTDYAQNPESILYNGPFKLVEWISGNSFKLEKNEQYWDNANTKIDTLSFKIAKDAQSAALEFDTGAADFVRITGEIVDKYRNDERLKVALGGYMWFLSVNLEGVDELNNKNLTLAIANAVDRTKLAELILKDGSQGANYFVPEELAASPTGKDFREDNGKGFFTEGPEKAKEYGKNAFEELNIDKLELELLFEDTDESKKVAEYIKAQVEQNVEGLTLQLKSQPKKARLQLQREGNYQLALHRWGPDYPDPMTYLDMYVTGTSYNFGGFSSPEYDALIDKAVNGNLPVQERWEVMKEAEKVLLKDGQGPIPIYQVGQTTLWNPKVSGVIYRATGASYIYRFADIAK